MSMTSTYPLPLSFPTFFAALGLYLPAPPFKEIFKRGELFCTILANLSCCYHLVRNNFPCQFPFSPPLPHPLAAPPGEIVLILKAQTPSRVSSFPNRLPCISTAISSSSRRLEPAFTQKDRPCATPTFHRRTSPFFLNPILPHFGSNSWVYPCQRKCLDKGGGILLV